MTEEPIIFKITHNGSWCFNIKTPLKDLKGTKIGFNAEGFQNEDEARKSCKEITDKYELKGYTIKETT